MNEVALVSSLPKQPDNAIGNSKTARISAGLSNCRSFLNDPPGRRSSRSPHERERAFRDLQKRHRPAAIGMIACEPAFRRQRGWGDVERTASPAGPNQPRLVENAKGFWPIFEADLTDPIFL